MSEQKWYVYVLQSADPVWSKTYVGVTTDPKRRLRQHNGEMAGGAKFPRAHRPWALRRVFGPFVPRPPHPNLNHVKPRGLAQRAEAILKKERSDRRLDYQFPSVWGLEGPQGKEHPLAPAGCGQSGFLVPAGEPLLSPDVVPSGRGNPRPKE